MSNSRWTGVVRSPNTTGSRGSGTHIGLLDPDPKNCARPARTRMHLAFCRRRWQPHVETSTRLLDESGTSRVGADNVGAGSNHHVVSATWHRPDTSVAIPARRRTRLEFEGVEVRDADRDPACVVGPPARQSKKPHTRSIREWSCRTRCSIGAASSRARADGVSMRPCRGSEAE